MTYRKPHNKGQHRILWRSWFVGRCRVICLESLDEQLCSTGESYMNVATVGKSIYDLSLSLSLSLFSLTDSRAAVELFSFRFKTS